MRSKTPQEAEKLRVKFLDDLENVPVGDGVGGTGNYDIKVLDMTVSASSLHMSFGRRLATVLLEAFFQITTGLIIVGYQGLMPVMLDAKMYQFECHPGDAIPCTRQNSRINAMFTSATAALNLWLGFAGFLLDSRGPRFIALLGSAQLALGSIIFAFGGDLLELSRWLDGYLVGYVIMAIGGASVITSSFHISNCFPAHRGLIMSLFMAGESFGSAVFLGFKWVHEAYGLSLQEIFLYYLVFPLLHAVFAYFLQTPVALSSEAGDGGHSSGAAAAEPVEMFRVVKEWRSVEWVVMVLWGSCGLTYSFFYVGSLNLQLAWLSGDSVDSDYVNHNVIVFSIMFIFVSIAAVFVVGSIVDRFGMWASMVLSVAVTIVWGALSVDRSCAHLQWVTFIFYILSRQCCLGVWGHYANVIFGDKAGLFLGISFTVAGVVIFSNHATAEITTEVFHGDYTVTNLVLTGWNAFLSAVMAYLTWNWRIPNSGSHTARKSRDDPLLIK